MKTTTRTTGIKLLIFNFYLKFLLRTKKSVEIYYYLNLFLLVQGMQFRNKKLLKLHIIINDSL
jgi:hypothetical protein